MIPDVWEALEKNEMLALNGIGYRENIFAIASKSILLYISVSVLQEIQNLCYNFLLVVLSQWHIFSLFIV